MFAASPGAPTASGDSAANPLGVPAAARILDQTTFGPTASLIQHVQQVGINRWLREQFDAPQTVLPVIPENFPPACGSGGACAESDGWNVALNGNDQLRQRVAFALSEIFVVSDSSVPSTAISPYSNRLAKDAFGNWYTLMKNVTLSTAMGSYLDMVNSSKAHGGKIANENFARENLQLFGIGLNLLNQDGTPQLDGNGNTIPAFTEEQVQAFARAYTGWTYANEDGSSPLTFNSAQNYSHAMVPVAGEHDESSKALLNGTVLPAGQTAEQDLDGALMNIFEHPNLPPFVCRQLIQHLVKGDPSPAYVARVAAVFIDNGSHVRGDLKAVLIAILTDPEARIGDSDASADGGHLREPILWTADILRGVGFVNTDPNGYYVPLTEYLTKLNEHVDRAPSVFGFFPPNYVIPGANLNAPEFALESTGGIGAMRTMINDLEAGEIPGIALDLGDGSPLAQLASNPVDLVDTLGVIFMHGRMDPRIRTAILDEVRGLKLPEQRARIATYLVVTAAAYRIDN